MATPSVAALNYFAADLGTPPRVTHSADWYYSLLIIYRFIA
jgi:hypothetical protein